METKSLEKLEDISLPLTEQEYRDMDHLSYSFLSKVDRIGAEAKEDDFQGNDGTLTGNLTEEILFGMYDRNKYYIADNVAPGGVLQETLDIVFQNAPASIFYSSETELQSYVEEKIENNPDVKFYTNWKVATRAKRIVDDGKAYIEFLRDSAGKIPVDTATYNTAVTLVNTLKTHPFTENLFKKKEGVDVFYQFKGTFELKGITIKFMVDMLKVDHNIQTIYIYDLKTGNKKPENFQKSYYYWRYDIQDYLYTQGIYEVLKRYFPNYKYNVMHFIYINNVGIAKPLIYRGLGNSSIIYNGYYVGDRYYKGIEELIEECQWYDKHNYQIDYPEQVYKANGVVAITDKYMDEVTIKSYIP